MQESHGLNHAHKYLLISCLHFESKLSPLAVANLKEDVHYTVTCSSWYYPSDYICK